MREVGQVVVAAPAHGGLLWVVSGHLVGANIEVAARRHCYPFGYPEAICDPIRGTIRV